ncbi:hypothetical protein JYU34_000369 [Plutella xylostella]|uniref:Uncharacterized protein n=1 Tax=Plutella xylostella TaxID=51655 RepID=A0ABQ7R7J4_PLUXY|nr:hypothetical protein JYU34_000369 [Plutella xylostella]
MENQGTISVFKNQRGQVKGLICKLCNFFAHLPTTTLSQDDLIVKEERLKQLFVRYESYNLKIIGSDPGDKSRALAFENSEQPHLERPKMSCGIDISVAEEPPARQPVIKSPPVPVDMSKLVLPPNNTLADKDFGVPSNIHILMGANVFFQVLRPLEPTSTATATSHTAHHASLPAPTIHCVNTHFGHIIAGNTYNHSNTPPSQLHCFTSQTISSFQQAECIPEAKTNLQSFRT